MIPQTVPRLSPPLRRSLIQSAVIVALLLPYHKSLPAQQMIFPDAAWQTATPESVLVDSKKLQAAVEVLGRTSHSVNELLVVRNGRVIWQGANVNQPITIWSGTKSFASTVLPIARSILTKSCRVTGRRCAPSSSAVPRPWVGRFTIAANAVKCSTVTIPVATDTAPSARMTKPRNGWKRNKICSCLCLAEQAPLSC